MEEAVDAPRGWLGVGREVGVGRGRPTDASTSEHPAISVGAPATSLEICYHGRMMLGGRGTGKRELRAGPPPLEGRQCHCYIPIYKCTVRPRGPPHCRPGACPHPTVDGVDIKIRHPSPCWQKITDGSAAIRQRSRFDPRPRRGAWERLLTTGMWSPRPSRS